MPSWPIRPALLFWQSCWLLLCTVCLLCELILCISSHFNCYQPPIVFIYTWTLMSVPWWAHNAKTWFTFTFNQSPLSKSASSNKRTVQVAQVFHILLFCPWLFVDCCMHILTCDPITLSEAPPPEKLEQKTSRDCILRPRFLTNKPKVTCIHANETYMCNCITFSDSRTTNSCKCIYASRGSEGQEGTRWSCTPLRRVTEETTSWAPSGAISGCAQPRPSWLLARQLEIPVERSPWNRKLTRC